MQGSLGFEKGTEIIVVKTENFSDDFVERAVPYAIRTRIQRAKNIAHAKRTAKAFSDGEWDVPHANLGDTIREMPVEQLAIMLDKSQRRALIDAINSLKY